MIARGPNILNLHAYTQGQEQTSNYNDQYDEQDGRQVSDQRHMVESKNIEDQFDIFLQQINRYDEILGTLAKNIDQINSNQQYITDFYPAFIVNTTYQNDQQKKVINTNQPQLMKIMVNLERVNKKLKQQMKGWTFQFAKKSQLTQNLLNENQILRKAICMKNKQIVKLIQTISNTQNDQILQLKQNLDILKQENGVLLEHLSKVTQEVKQRQQDSKRIQQALTSAKNHYIEVEKQSQKIEDQQDHLSKTVALLQQSLNQILRRKKKLQKQKNRLIQVRQDYANDENFIQYQVESCQEDKKLIDKQLKQRFQDQQKLKIELIDDIEEHTEKIQKHKQKQRFLQSQISRNQHRLQEFNKINKDLKTKFEANTEIAAKLKKQFQKIIDSQASMSSQIDILTSDISTLKQQLKSYDQIQKQNQQKIKSQLKALEQQNSKNLSQYRSKQMKQMKQLTKKMFQDKLQLSIKQKQVAQWENKIQTKKQEINELKNQMKQIRSNQTKANQLRIKLRQFK